VLTKCVCHQNTQHHIICWYSCVIHTCLCTYTPIHQLNGGWQEGVAILLGSCPFRYVSTGRSSNRVELVQWMRWILCNSNNNEASIMSQRAILQLFFSFALKNSKHGSHHRYIKITYLLGGFVRWFACHEIIFHSGIMSNATKWLQSLLTEIFFQTHL